VAVQYPGRWVRGGALSGVRVPRPVVLKCSGVRRRATCLGGGTGPSTARGDAFVGRRRAAGAPSGRGARCVSLGAQRCCCRSEYCCVFLLRRGAVCTEQCTAMSASRTENVMRVSDALSSSGARRGVCFCKARCDACVGEALSVRARLRVVLWQADCGT